MRVWVPNLVWVDNYTGYYSGQVTKPSYDTRVWEYIQRYRGLAYTKEVMQLNYSSPKNSEAVNEPVNILTGNYYSTDTDLSISDLGLPLEIIRYYNSLDTRVGMLGSSWRISYDSTISADVATGKGTIIYPDGHTVVFEPKSGTNEYTAPESIFDTLVKNVDGTYSLELQNKLEYIYNTAGRLSAITDQNGNSVTLRYDGSGALISVNGAGGKSLSFTSENGRIKTITDPDGRIVEYNYDVSGKLLQVKSAGGGIKKYEYNSKGLRSITDENGRKFIVNEYDEYGRVILQYDENGSMIEYSYGDANMENAYTVISTGKGSKYKYNEKLYIIKKTFDDGTYEEYTYDQYGNRDSIRDRNGNISRYTFDERGNLISITSPAPYNYTTSYTYDENDKLTSITTGGGAYRSFEYDTGGNLVKADTRLDESTYASTLYSYDAYGRLTSVTDGEGGITTLQYGSDSNPLRIIDAEGNITEFGYDVLGRRKSISTAYGTTTFEYNKKDRLEKITDPAGNITRMKYDLAGNLTKLINPQQYDLLTDDGTGYTNDYDALDRLVRQTDPLGAVLALKYDEEGNRIKEINPDYYDSASDDGAGIGYEYDGSGRLTKVINPSGQKSRIEYDAVGNRTKVIDANNYDEETDDGPGIEYTYDKLNRLVEVKDTGGNVIKRLVYDRDGRIIKEMDAKGYLSGQDDSSRYGTVYRYNLAGWLVEKRSPVKKEDSIVYYQVTAYTYDKTGKLTSQKMSPEYVGIDQEPALWNNINYVYDRNGRVNSVTDNTGAYMEYTYDALGNTTSRKVKINDNKYKTTGYQYDGSGRLVRVQNEIDAEDLNVVSTGKIQAEALFEYDKNGNVTKVTSPEGYVTTFEYDDAGRLIARNEEVSEDEIDVKRTVVSISSPKTTVYPGQEYEYKVEMQTDTSVKGFSIEMEYDARMLELVSVVPMSSAVRAGTGTLGKIQLDTENTSINGNAALASLIFRVRDGCSGTGYITVSSSSFYTDAVEKQYKFTELTGKTMIVKKPDMNGDGNVELNDFTFTALKKGTLAGSSDYDEKFDVNGNGFVDTPDLDYMKDYLFTENHRALNQIDLARFFEKATGAAYKAGSKKVIRRTAYEYDKSGNLVKETDSNGNSITYTYDVYNRLISVTDSTGAKSRVFYDEAGNRIKEVLPENYNTEADDGVGTTYTYDAMNRLKEVKDALGNVVRRNVYDTSGLLVKVIDAAGYKAGSSDTTRYGMEYAYDAGNRVVTVTTPEAKARGKASESYAYDAAGSVVGFTDGEGNATTYERDIWGRATRVTDAEGGTSQYTYDYAGNITSVTDENGHTTYYTYNSLNLLSTMKDPEGQTVSYKYDREGRLVKETDRNGRDILYDYNSDSSLTQKRIAGEEYERFLYNKDGSLMAAINASGVDVFEYTADNLLRKKTRNGTTMLEYEYNKNGSVTKVTDNTGAVTGYTYDALGRLKEVLDETNKVALYSYNADSTISNISYSSGEKTDYIQSLSIAYKYDRDKNMISLTSINPEGGIINEFKYAYDNNGNQVEKAENGKTTTYAYDELNRLVEAGSPESGTGTFAYDAAGNRLSRTQGEEATTYVYDALNRLTQSTNNGIITAYSYDNNGNLLSETMEGYVELLPAQCTWRCGKSCRCTGQGTKQLRIRCIRQHDCLCRDSSQQVQICRGAV